MALPKFGVNIKPTIGTLFNEDTLDIIIGVATGGLYHLRTKRCPLDGNINGDENSAGYDIWDVLDIVILANCILAQNCNELENGCAGDIDDDGNYNVLDIVALANCVLMNNCSG